MSSYGGRSDDLKSLTPAPKPVKSTVERLPSGRWLATGAIDGSQIGTNSANKTFPAGMGATDGTAFLPLFAGLEIHEAEHNDSLSFNKTFAVPPTVLVFGGLGFQPASVWGTRAQVNSTQNGNSDAYPGVTVTQQALKKGEDITTTGCTIVALLEEEVVSLTARTANFDTGALTVANTSKDLNTDLGTDLPANNDEFEVQLTYRVKAQVNATKTPDWASVEIVVEIAFNDGGGYDVKWTKTYTAEADGLGASSDSGTVNVVVPLTVTGMSANEQVRIRLVSVSLLGNVDLGNSVATVDPVDVAWSSLTGGPNNYARATDGTHKVKVLVFPS